jgi:imidazolonepropionase-like amidohydrolase
MNLSVLFHAFVFVFVFAFETPATAESESVNGCGTRPTLEIISVHIIDVRTGRVSYDATITIDGDRICRIAFSQDTAGRAQHRIDGRGRYVLPGLWFNRIDGPAAATLIGYGITQMAEGVMLDQMEPAELPDVLAQSVAGGRTPLQALQSVTMEAGSRAGVAHAGRLEAGCEANLLLLEANPLEDVTNLRHVTLVLRRGKPLGLVALARARAGRSESRQPFSN